MSTSVPFDGGAPMPAPLPPLPLGDEEALHRVFLAEYPALAAEARTDLGEEGAGFGAHVVEGAFVRAWDARTRLTTPESVHDFLVEDVHHAAARALSQRAIAHRMGTHGGTSTHAQQHAVKEMDPDESWARIQHALHDRGSPEVVHAAMASSRHEAATHIANVEKRAPWWVAVVAVVAIGLVLWGGFHWADRAGEDSRVAQALSSGDMRTVTSIPGQIGMVALAEGSNVKLAPDSKLSIPQDYGPKLRAVQLEGDAAFTVAPDQPGDFRVYTGNAIVVATGTAFTVRAYADDPGTTVVVTEGTVNVRHGDQSDAVSAGSALVIPKSGAAHVASQAERNSADAWRTGTIVIDDAPLGSVLPELRRWYGLDVHVPDAALRARTVSLKAPLDSSHQAIQQIEQGAGAKFGYVGDTMVFQPAPKSAPGAAPAKGTTKKR